MTAGKGAFWSNQIQIERVGNIPFRMYAERPTRIESLLPFAARWGDRPYIIQGDRTLSFAGLLRDSEAKAAALARRGVQAGGRVILFGWNSPDWVVNYWACLRLGAVPVLGNAWWGEQEIADALALLRPALVLADRRAAARLPAGPPVGEWGPDGTGVAPTLTAGGENDPAVIVFTSGTGGSPKAVVLPHRAFIASMLMMLDVTHALPFMPDQAAGEVALHTGPLFHIGGSHALIRGVVAGNTLVFPSGRFDPGEALELFERYKITRWTAVVPTMVARLLDHPDAQTRDLRSLMAIGIGGAPVHPALLERLRTGLPGAEPRVAVGYGLTENAGQATAASGKSSAARPGSSGRPLPLVELRIDPAAGSAEGEVLVRSPTQMLGYFGVAESPIDPDGWLHTGDLGRIDDGLLWITGRSKDIIIRGGENIAPAAVERALAALPAVAEAAVIGVPHADLGEEVMAFVVLKHEATEDELKAQLRPVLASFAIPSRWCLQHEPLPTNQTGKIDKKALQARGAA